MVDQPIPFFSAAEFASALHLSKRAVLLRLNSAAAVLQPGRGGERKFWPVASLPAPWRDRLDATARQRGCRDAAHLLQTLAEAWELRDDNGLPVALSSVHPRFIEKASKLRDALSVPLRQQHEMDGADLRDLGLRHFSRVYGYLLSRKQWQRLFDRTIQRDRGAEHWDRLEIYLDAAAFARSKAQTKPVRKARFDHRDLADLLKDLLQKDRLTPGDRDEIFTQAFRRYDVLAGQHPESDRAAIKGSLITFLWELFGPKLATTPESWRRVFDGRLAKHRRGEEHRDRRPLESGNFRRPDFSQDLREIAKLAVCLDGNETAARRLLEDQGKLSPEFTAYYPLDQRHNKSALPKKVREEITPLVNAAAEERRGPKRARDAGPYTSRDWSDAKPGDGFVFDDVTWNHYFKVQCPDGSWDVLRGECLVGTDELSDYPLDFLLIAGHYNSLHTRHLIGRILTNPRLGLPRHDLILERGVWDSHLNVGEKAARRGWRSIHWRNFENGLRDPRIAIDIHQARIHRAKTIESFFGRLQDRMRCIPGFVGFNERSEKMERMEPLIARARRGDAEALAHFLTQGQWRDNIREVMEEFRHQPGNGDRLRGRTPFEAWSESVMASPLRSLPKDAQHLVLTHEKVARLHSTRGVVLKIPGRQMPVCYANEHTGAMVERGETHLRVRIDLEHPDLITCSDMKGTTRFTVLALRAPAKHAPRELLADIARAKAAHRHPARTLFGEIQHPTSSTITRDADYDEATLEDGRHHNAAAATYKTEEQARSQKLREIERKATAIGASIPATVRNPERVLSGLEWEKEILAELEEAEQDNPTTP